MPPCLYRVGDSQNKPPGMGGSLYTAASGGVAVGGVPSGLPVPGSLHEGGALGIGRPRIQRYLLPSFRHPKSCGSQNHECWCHLDADGLPGAISPTIPTCMNLHTHSPDWRAGRP